MEIEKFYQKAVDFSPNPIQHEVWNQYYSANGHPALLIKAKTGTGKTEAILLPAIADNRRIIMVLPSKALIEDMGARVKKIGENLSRNQMIDLSITIDMGGSCHRYLIKHGKTEENRQYRHLFADDIIITTLDKFLFRLFGYGENIKSFIFPHRVFGNSLKKKPLVIFDEAHEYDNLAFSNFKKLLETLFIKGKDICVMSATLPENFSNFLETIDAVNGILGKQQYDFQSQGVVGFDKYLELINATKDINSIIAEEIKERYAPDKRIIARTEYVKDLIELHEKLNEFNPLIYHGRMTYPQRKKVIDEIIEKQKKNQGFLILATSAIEAGCDLDAHLIVTELCNPDSLVQLAGRLNRRGKMHDGKLVIVGNQIKERVSNLNTEQVNHYLHDLNSMNGVFQPETLGKYFKPPQTDWMGNILFDMLWEYVYEADLTCKPLWERGILVTRSWEPSVTLCTGLDQHNKPLNPIQIKVSALVKRINPDNFKAKSAEELNFSASNQEWHAEIKRSYYYSNNKEGGNWVIKELTKYPVSCYETDLLCVINDQYTHNYFDDTIGYRDIPKLLLKGYRDGFKQFLDQPELKKDGYISIESGKRYPKFQKRVWFLERLEK